MENEKKVMKESGERKKKKKSNESGIERKK